MLAVGAIRREEGEGEEEEEEEEGWRRRGEGVEE